jgi:CRISPR-associated endonuclease Cas2
VARTLERKAIRLQYSVFLGIWTAAALEEVLRSLEDQVHRRKDDLRAYRLPKRCRPEFYGRLALEENLVLAERGFGLLELLGSRGPGWLAERVAIERGPYLERKEPV